MQGMRGQGSIAAGSPSKADAMPVVVYTPAAALRHPLALVQEMVADLGRSRALAWRFAVRDIRAQHRDSILGLLWSFITPVFSAATWLFLQFFGVVRVSDTGIPYAAYVFTGTMLWSIFTEALNSPLMQLNGARGLLAKLNFPRESVILAGVIKVLYSAAIKLVILLPAVVWFGVRPNELLALFPIALLALLLAGFSLGLLLAPLGMLFGDVSRVLPILTQVAMYTAPVVFAMPKEGAIRTLFELNFMTPLVLTGRAWFTGFPSPMPGYFLAVMGASLLLLLLAWVFFRITLPAIIERMSS